MKKKRGIGCLGVILVMLIMLLLLFLFLIFISVGYHKTNNDNSSNKSTTNNANSFKTEQNETEQANIDSSENKENNSSVEEMKNVIKERILSEYNGTDIESIELNENLGSEEEGDYIAIVRLTWNVPNSPKTSKEVLKMYSDDLAATVAKECDKIAEIAIFWTVPNLNDAGAKCSYERKNGGMYEMDIMWDSVFN